MAEKESESSQLDIGFGRASPSRATAGATGPRHLVGPGYRPFTPATRVQSPPGTLRQLPDFYPALAARIRARLVSDPGHPGCLVFPTKPGKHARIKHGGKLYSPHRVITELAAGRLLKPGRGKEDACHHCDNPPCCNPEHLFAGSRRDNIVDAVRKGRAGQFTPGALLKLSGRASVRNRCRTCNRWIRDGAGCVPCSTGEPTPGSATRFLPAEGDEISEMRPGRIEDRSRARDWLAKRREAVVATRRAQERSA